MNSNLPVVLTLLADPELADNTDRVAAAVGLRALRIQTPNRKSWISAAAAVIDEDGARQCTRAGMPRRDGVFVLGTSDPSPSLWEAAIEVGAQQLVVVPAQEAELVRHLSEAAEAGGTASRRGRRSHVTRPSRGYVTLIARRRVPRDERRLSVRPTVYEHGQVRRRYSDRLA